MLDEFCLFAEADVCELWKVNQLPLGVIATGESARRGRNTAWPLNYIL